MSDHPKSTPAPSPDPDPAPSWEDNPTFRETFLLYLPPDLHPAVRETGRRIFSVVLELELPPLPKPWVHMRLQAVAADLRFLRQFLGAIAEDRFKASLSEEEARLAERAEAWALKVQQIAHRIEEATS